MDFDKQEFSELLKLAKGRRSINKFSIDSDVDAGYISRLIRCQVSKPPSAKIIGKLAAKSHNNVSNIELMTAAGYLEDGSKESRPEHKTNPDIRAISRAGEKMTDEEAERLRKVAETLFPDAFKNEEDP